MHIFHTNYGPQTFTDAETAAIGRYVANILETHDNTSLESRIAGINWYPTAEEIARRLAAQFGISTLTAAKIIAVTSNNVKWEVQVKYLPILIGTLLRNMNAGMTPEEAGAVTKQGPFMTTYRTRAAYILLGDYSVLNGEKVTAFAENIAGNHSVVTVDRWAVRAALAMNFTNENLTMKMMKGRARLLIDAAYHEAARVMGMTPAALQAVVWLGAIDTAKAARLVA